jgi:hypothetical protein
MVGKSLRKTGRDRHAEKPSPDGSDIFFNFLDSTTIKEYLAEIPRW